MSTSFNFTNTIGSVYITTRGRWYIVNCNVAHKHTSYAHANPKLALLQYYGLRRILATPLTKHLGA